MPPSARRPWPLLLSKLQRAEPATISYAEVLAAHAEPVLLVAEGVAEYGRPDDYVPPDCEHACLPNLNYDLRASERLVGVACPQEPACWPGWRWMPQDEVLTLECSAARVFGALREENGLLPLELPLGVPATPIGRLRRRGLDVPVVWLRARRGGFDLAARGLRQQLGGDGLIVMVPKDPRARFAASERIVVIELDAASGGHLGLTRGLDELDPGYRARAARRDEPDAEVDWIHLRFATEEKRHVLVVNGHDFVGFRKGDAVFARLLLLAAARKHGHRGGWRNKASLVGDFSARPDKATIARANKALEGLRKELVADDVPGLTHGEQDAILKAERGTEKVRLAVVPENIVLDESLASPTWKVPATTRGKSGTTKLSEKQSDGVEVAMLLLAEARRLGAPGVAGEVPTPLAAKPTKGRSSRSGT